MTPYFHLVALDLQKKINPTSAPGYFMVGSNPGQVPTAIVEAELKAQEARVLSSIPEKWRRMSDRIEGLVAVRYATDGQTTFTPVITPTADTQIFINYPSSFGNGMKVFGRPTMGSARVTDVTESFVPANLKPYAERTFADSTEDWSLADGVITLATPLAEGSHVIMDFNHDSLDQCTELKTCVLELAAAEILRGYPTMSENVADKIDGWEKNAQLFLRRLWNAEGGYRTGIQFFDKLKLVGELETRISGGVRKTSPGLGMLF